MKIRTKLIILLLIPTLAFVAYSGSAFIDSRKAGAENAKISRLTDLATVISSLVHECQRERGYTAGYLGSEGKQFVSELTTQTKLTDEAASRLKSFVADNPIDDPEVAHSYTQAVDLFEATASIRSQVRSQSIETTIAIGHYTRMNTLFIDTIAYIAHVSSNEHLSRELVAYTNFLKLKERAGIERAVLANAFAADQFTKGMYAKFVALVEAQSNFNEVFASIASAQTKAMLEETRRDSSFKRVEEFRALASERAQEGQFGVNPSEWFSASTNRINKLKEAEDKIGQSLLETAHSLQSQAFLSSLISVIVLIFTASGGAWMVHNISSPIRAIVAAIDIIAQGDLTAEIPENRKDELGMIARSINKMSCSLRSVINEIIATSQELAAASTEITANSEQLSGGMSEQSSHLNQISAAIQQMSASISEVAQKSSDASGQASNSHLEAQRGGKVVAETVSSIESIESMVNMSVEIVSKLGNRSTQIGEVINTINEIAEQTNLLALNAAIEAARAGEHGRGFAVVADEVRKLAERTTTATAEVSESIRDIQTDTGTAVESINKCQSGMREGVVHAQHAGTTLDSILEANTVVNNQISDIAAAAEQQATACDSLSGNIEQISSLIEQSVQGVQEAASAAAMLSKNAESMQSMICRFKVA